MRCFCLIVISRLLPTPFSPVLTKILGVGSAKIFRLHPTVTLPSKWWSLELKPAGQLHQFGGRMLREVHRIHNAWPWLIQRWRWVTPAWSGWRCTSTIRRPLGLLGLTVWLIDCGMQTHVILGPGEIRLKHVWTEVCKEIKNEALPWGMELDWADRFDTWDLCWVDVCLPPSDFFYKMNKKSGTFKNPCISMQYLCMPLHISRSKGGTRPYAMSSARPDRSRERRQTNLVNQSPSTSSSSSTFTGFVRWLGCVNQVTKASL